MTINLIQDQHADAHMYREYVLGFWKLVFVLDVEGYIISVRGHSVQTQREGGMYVRMKSCFVHDDCLGFAVSPTTGIGRTKILFDCQRDQVKQRSLLLQDYAWGPTVHCRKCSRPNAAPAAHSQFDFEADEPFDVESMTVELRHPWFLNIVAIRDDDGRPNTCMWWLNACRLSCRCPNATRKLAHGRCHTTSSQPR